jgi:hypothetical protein
MKPVHRIHDRETTVVVGRDPFGRDATSDVDSGNRASSEEHQGDAPCVVGKRALK